MEILTCHLTNGATNICGYLFLQNITSHSPLLVVSRRILHHRKMAVLTSVTANGATSTCGRLPFLRNLQKLHLLPPKYLSYPLYKETLLVSSALNGSQSAWLRALPEVVAMTQSRHNEPYHKPVEIKEGKYVGPSQLLIVAM